MSLQIEALDLQVVARSLYPWASPNRVSLENRKNALRLQGRLTPAVQESYVKAEVLRAGTRAIVYIAGCLTGVDEKTKERYGAVSDLVASYDGLFFGYAPHLHGTDPVKHPQVTATEVRDVDNLWAVAVADLHVNFLNPLAHGNAIEEGWAEKEMIPTVYMVSKDMQLSRLARGMENVARVISYEDFETDGKEQLKVFFDEFAAWLQHFPDRDPREFFYMSIETLNPLIISKGQFDHETLAQLMSEEPSYPACEGNEILVYIKDPTLPNYGKAGLMISRFYDSWSRYLIDFGDHQLGIEGPKDWVNSRLSFWLA